MRQRFLLAAGLLGFAGMLHNQERPEWIRHVIAEGFSNQTAIAADFTGDGRLDVITGDITPNRERTILYVAPDWKPIVLHTGIRTIHGAVIDVDGNGKPDFVGARYHPGLVYWLERPADPLRDPWPYHVVDDSAQGGADGVHGLWAGDIDRDGKIDLAASSGQPVGALMDSLVWFRIPPQPRTAARWERYLVADRDAPGLSHYVALADVNGDGRPDLTAASKDSPGGNWFAWWEQGADARKPWKKHLIAGDQFGASNLLAADLNGDGKVDFVGSRGHGVGVTWYEGPGLTPHDIDTSLKGPHSLAVADLNGDNKPDVVTVAKDSRVAAWFENDGKGGFKEHRTSTDQSAYDIRLVDMDADGDLDLLVAGFESKNVVWYENRIRKAAPELTIEIRDYMTMPMTGAVDGTTNSAGLLAKVNVFRQEPGANRKRFFVNDVNGPLYILDKDTKKLHTYLDFNGLPGRPGLFHRLAIDNLLASGFISFQFDPDYARNGKFYTIHMEDPALPASALPDNASFPGLKTAGYAVTPGIAPFGATQRESVVVEWTDSNISNSTFEGTARELMRLQYNGRIHPMGDLIFNPVSRPGDPDWRVMYISSGDGGSGEQRSDIRNNPQRLDTLVGKILRIIPDLQAHVDSSTVSENGRYRIPKDNPFAATPGARKEIWAYGLRNPYRMTWDVDPADRAGNHLLASVIGLRTWETVVIVRKGANYGYSLREGPEQLKADNTLSPPPDPDKIPIRIDGSATAGEVAPTYPVLAYGHIKGSGGDAVSNGFVYRGKAIPALRGKFIFGDITTGRIWWADFKEMLAADDGDPRTMAEMHEVKISWNKEVYGTMAPITEITYHARGGKSEHLPGNARVAGGRSDIRFATDSDGELYILSKSDGMIRTVVNAAAK